MTYEFAEMVSSKIISFAFLFGAMHSFCMYTSILGVALHAEYARHKTNDQIYNWMFKLNVQLRKWNAYFSPGIARNGWYSPSRDNRILCFVRAFPRSVQSMNWSRTDMYYVRCTYIKSWYSTATSIPWAPVVFFTKHHIFVCCVYPAFSWEIKPRAKNVLIAIKWNFSHCFEFQLKIHRNRLNDEWNALSYSYFLFFIFLCREQTLEFVYLCFFVFR